MILGRKIRNPRLNSKKDLFLKNTTILGQKIRNLRLNSSENLFFLENTLIWGQKLVYVLEPHTIFCPTHKVLHVNCMTSLKGHKFSSLIMFAITSIKTIGSPKLYSRFPLNIWVATKKVEKHCYNT